MTRAEECRVAVCAERAAHGTIRSVRPAPLRLRARRGSATAPAALFPARRRQNPEAALRTYSLAARAAGRGFLVRHFFFARRLLF